MNQHDKLVKKVNELQKIVQELIVLIKVPEIKIPEVKLPLSSGTQMSGTQTSGLRFSRENITKRVKQQAPPLSTENSVEKCIYYYKKGAKNGMKCETKIKEGSVYCSRHCKKKKAPALVSAKPSPPHSPVHAPVNLNPVLNVQLGEMVDSKLNLVVKNGIVVGTVQNGKITELNPASIEKCKKYGFKYELVNHSSDVVEEQLENFDEDEDQNSYA